MLSDVLEQHRGSFGMRPVRPGHLIPGRIPRCPAVVAVMELNLSCEGPT